MEEGGHIISRTMTTIDTDAYRRGRWHRWAGDQGRALTLAIVVAVSVVDIGRRQRWPLSWPSTSRPSAWLSKLSNHPLLMSAIVAAIDEWDMWWGAYGKKVKLKSNHLLIFFIKKSSIIFWSIIN